MNIPRPSGLWRHGDFMKLWTAQTVSLVGSQVTTLALPLTAILLLRATPFEVGLLATVQYLPFLVVGLPAGVLVDRLPRRPLLVASDVIRALLLLLVPVAYWTGTLRLPLLYPVAFVAGVLTVVFEVAHKSYLPSLVGRERLLEGNTKLEMSYSGAQIAGFGLGGALVQLLTAPVAILADAVSFVCSGTLLLLIGRHEPPTAGEARRWRGAVGEIRQGLRFVIGHPMIRPLALATGISNLFYLFGMTGAVLTLFAVRELGMSPARLGLVLAIGNVGAIAGSLASARVIARWGLGGVLVITSMVSALAVLLISIATSATAVPLIAAAVLIGEVGIAIYNISQITIRQTVTPAAWLGRMNATYRFLIWGAIPIGAFLGGVLGQTIGLRPTLWVAAAGSLLPGLPVLFSRLRSVRDLAEVERDESLVAARRESEGRGA